jgi:hypothetical protein
MRLSPIAVAIGAAFIWGAAIFVIGGVNALVPGYGEPVLALVVSLYPGYDASGTLADLLLGTAFAIFDGLAAGWVFATLYNFVVRLSTPGAGLPEPKPVADSGAAAHPTAAAEPVATDSGDDSAATH